MNISQPLTCNPPPIASMSLALRLARRELGGGLGPLKLLAVCLFLGVLALAGVGSLESAITKGLAVQGQQLLGGDVEARLTQRFPSEAERTALASFGGTLSDTVKMRAMVRGESGPAADRQLLAELKAVDRHWPLYGEPAIAGASGKPAVQQALTQGAVVGQSLADQLGLRTGDLISVGEARFPVSAILTVEPDRAGEGFALGPTVLIALDKLDETGLIQPGSLYRSHSRLKLPLDLDPVDVTKSLDQQFPDAGWRLADRRDGAPGIRRFVERLGQFLTLVSLTALTVGGVGVGNGVKSYLDRRGGTIATLKALGASSQLISRTYLILIAGVALAAALLGATAGALVPWIVVQLAGDALPVPPVVGIHPAPLLAGIAFGMLVAFAFALPPLDRARALPVQQILRGSIEGWPRASRRVLILSIALGLAVAGLAVLISAERLFALGFLAAVLLLLATLGALATAVKWVTARLPRPRNTLARLAIANLNRPGATSQQLVVALGLGLTLFATLALVETSFRMELNRTVPREAPGFVLLDLPKEDGDRFRAMLPPGTDYRMVPSLRGPVTAIRDVPISELEDVPEGSWMLRGDRGLTFAEELPAGNTIVAGQWWPEDYQGPPLVSMDAEQADLLGLKVGDSITVSVLGVDITATIASLRRIDWDSLGFNFVLIFDPASLSPAPFTWMATVSPPPATEAGFTGLVSRAFPTVSVVRVKDVITQVGDIVGQMGMAVRIAATVTILAGIAVLVGALAAQARSRIRDNVILKILGANRRQLMTAAAIEYALLGLIVAATALLLGALAAWAVVTQILDLGWQPDWWVAIATILCGALVTLVLGLVGAWRTLGTGTSRVLRES